VAANDAEHHESGVVFWRLTITECKVILLNGTLKLHKCEVLRKNNLNTTYISQ